MEAKTVQVVPKRSPFQTHGQLSPAGWLQLPVTNAGDSMWEARASGRWGGHRQPEATRGQKGRSGKQPQPPHGESPVELTWTFDLWNYEIIKWGLFEVTKLVATCYAAIENQNNIQTWEQLEIISYSHSSILYAH